MQSDFPIDELAATIRAALARQDTVTLRDLLSADSRRRDAALNAISDSVAAQIHRANWVVFEGPAAAMEAPGFERD
ncbi:MAG: hypothetical protein ACM30I_07985 [Gemmatimonas sp.]